MLVSADGLASRFLDRAIDAGVLPTFEWLQQEGAWTHNARTVVGSTSTLPNHVSMLTGRPAAQHGEMESSVPHMYLENSTTPEDVTLHTAGNPEQDYMHSVFDVVHDAGLNAAFSAGKTKFELLQRSWQNAPSPEHVAADKQLDKFVYSKVDGQESSPDLVAALIQHLSGSPVEFTFAHLRDADQKGHHHGWGSPEYDEALQTVDAELERLLELLTEHDSYRERSYLIVTTDHGGVGTSHRDAEDPHNYTIPFYVWGPDIPPGVDLYDLAGDRRVDPGKGQLPFVPGQPQPIRNADAANLVLSLLQMGDTVPGSVGLPLWAATFDD